MIFNVVNSRRILIWTLLLTLSSAEAAEQLYRYRNAEGNVVVDYQVPVDLISGGYEVLNDKGIVIEVVPRALTEEERKAKDAEKKREQAARAEQDRLRQWDESLLLRYTTVADIEDAKRRALGELQIRMSILKGNRYALKQRVENYQAQAADMERTGANVDVDRLRTIEALQNEIAATDRSVVERQREIEKLEGAFQADIERFEMLLEVVELRQTLRAERENQPK